MFQTQSPRQVQGHEMLLGMGYGTLFRPPMLDAKLGKGQGLRRWFFGDIDATDWDDNGT